MDNTGREGEEALFDIIRSTSPEDDGSQYLNTSGEGMMFDEDEQIDEGDNNDDEGNVRQITKTGEVYLLYKPSGDHDMY
jgi:hypothetical protein